VLGGVEVSASACSAAAANSSSVGCFRNPPTPVATSASTKIARTPLVIHCHQACGGNISYTGTAQIAAMAMPRMGCDQSYVRFAAMTSRK
jgi:hypothetical protein